MASRFDQPTNEPDFGQFDDKPIDAADEPRDGEPWPTTDSAEAQRRINRLSSQRLDALVPDFDAPDAPLGSGLLDRFFTREVPDPSVGETVRVPDFVPPVNYSQGPSLTAAIDPAEHAAHALIEALTTLEQQIVLNLEKQDLERAWFLQNILSRAFTHVDLVAGKAMDAIDQITERRR